MIIANSIFCAIENALSLLISSTPSSIPRSPLERCTSRLTLPTKKIERNISDAISRQPMRGRRGEEGDYELPPSHNSGGMRERARELSFAIQGLQKWGGGGGGRQGNVGASHNHSHIPLFPSSRRRRRHHLPTVLKRTYVRSETSHQNRLFESTLW